MQSRRGGMFSNSGADAEWIGLNSRVFWVSAIECRARGPWFGWIKGICFGGRAANPYYICPVDYV